MPHRRRIPLRAALRRRYAGLVQVSGDRAQRVAAGTLPLNAANDCLRDRGRTAEPDTLRALDRKGFRRALRDQPALGS